MHLVLMGAGGHAREILDVLESTVASRPAQMRASLFAEERAITPQAKRLITDRGYRLHSRIPPEATHYVAAVGDPQLRQRLSVMADAQGLTPWPVLSPMAVVPASFAPGEGFVGFPGTYISTNVSIGRHCHVNLACQISHDVRLGDFVTLSPGALITGSATIGDGVFIGAGAVLLPGVSVGDGATVGAGSVVRRDVDPMTTVVGVPARTLERA